MWSILYTMLTDIHDIHWLSVYGHINTAEQRTNSNTVIGALLHLARPVPSSLYQM